MKRTSTTILELTPAEVKEAVVDWLNNRPPFEDQISIEQVEVAKRVHDVAPVKVTIHEESN